MLHLILIIIGLLVLYRLVVLLFWCVAYVLARLLWLALYLLRAILALISPQPEPTQTGGFGRRQRHSIQAPTRLGTNHKH
jgi:hypothetical protein